jgi:O-antigen/teichoic acid export membrane protein
VTNIVVIINTNVFSVILGRMYTPHVVGNYTQANKWNYMGWSLISGMLNGIAQPVFAKTDQDIARQRNIFRKLLRFTAFVSFPLMLGLALVAKEFIVILLGEKWVESARLLQLLCVMGAFYPVSNLFSNLLVARGHSATYMWCNIGLCAAQLCAVIVSAAYGIERMIEVYVAITIGWILVWHYFAHREIRLRLWEVVKDVSPYLLLTGALLYGAQWLTHGINNLYACFGVKVLVVAVAYPLVLWVTGSTIFRESMDFIFRKGTS